MTAAPVREALIARLHESIQQMAAAASRAGEPPPGEWSARDVVRHLVAVEEVVWQRRLADLADAAGSVDSAVSGPPSWSWTEPGRWSGEGDGTLRDALEELRRRRDATIASLRELNPASWSHYGIHATFGRLDVAGLFGVALTHDAEHLAQLAALEEPPSGVRH